MTPRACPQGCRSSPVFPVGYATRVARDGRWPMSRQRLSSNARGAAAPAHLRGGPERTGSAAPGRASGASAGGTTRCTPSASALPTASAGTTSGTPCSASCSASPLTPRRPVAGFVRQGQKPLRPIWRPSARPSSRWITIPPPCRRSETLSVDHEPGDRWIIFGPPLKLGPHRAVTSALQRAFRPPRKDLATRGRARST